MSSTSTAGSSARTSSTSERPIACGSWSGTSRKLSLSSASSGTIVFTPGPVWPPARPWTSKVGRAQIRSMISSGTSLSIRSRSCARFQYSRSKPERRKPSTSAGSIGRTPSCQKRARSMIEAMPASSRTGLRAAPPTRPECAALPAVRSRKIACSDPRRPIEIAGCALLGQIVSDTITASHANCSRRACTASAKWGLPISSSVSHRHVMSMGSPAAAAQLAARSAHRPGPLSSVVPRPS